MTHIRKDQPKSSTTNSSERANLVPQLRFKGFTDPWEQQQLGKISLKTGSGGTPNSHVAEYYNGSIPFLSISDIHGRYVSRTVKSITTAGLYHSAAWLVPAGSITLSMYASYGKVAILAKPMATSQAFFNAVIKPLSLRDFVYERLKLANINHEWDRLVSTGTQPNLNAQKIKNWTFKLPSTQEQTAIASFFKTLDSLIDAAERQRNLLKEQKQAYLQKLFPKYGKQEPQFRFKGFSNQWAQQPLRKIAISIQRKNSNRQAEHVLTISAEQGLIDQTQYFKKRIASNDDSSYILIKRGEFAYNKSYSHDFPFGTIKRLHTYSQGALSPLYIVFKVKNENVFPPYIEFYFDADVWHREINRVAAEGARNHGLLNLTPADFFNIKIQYPLEFKEQSRIAEFLATVSSLIAATERKIDLLRKLKQGYLQRMFI